MKVTLVAAVSSDGFIASVNDKNPYLWTSKEDQKIFKTILTHYPLHIMGRLTYEVSKPIPAEHTVKIVLTTLQQKYKDIDDKILFRDLSPQELVLNYSGLYKSALLLGGAKVYTDFLEAQLVDEVILTREPKKLRKGTPLLSNDKTIDDYLRETPHKKTILNSSGTVQCHYILKK